MLLLQIDPLLRVEYYVKVVVNMKILIVEDNEDSRILLMKQLRAHGHEVIAATDGVEALQQALAEIPDIMISDIMMPNMDGYQLCQQCKQNDKLRDIPFVFYTATYNKEEDEKFALSLGADAFVPKPTEFDTFVQMLFEIVEKAESSTLASSKIAPLEPSLFLSEYTKRVVAKLEDKVTELEESEKKLKQTTETWVTTFNSIPDLVSIHDKDLRIVRVNKAFADAFKTKPEELIGKYCYEIFHRTNEPWPDCPYKKMIETQKPTSVEFFEPHLGIHCEVVTSPTFNDEGDVMTYVHVAKDISERNRVEHSIAKRIKELTCLYGISQLVVSTDANLDKVMKGTFDLILNGWQYPEITCARVTFSGKEFKTDNFAVAEWKQCSDIRVRDEKIGTLEVYYLEEKPDIHEGPFLKEERDLIDGIARILGEFTERKQAEEELEEAEEKWRSLGENAPDIIMLVDRDSTIRFINHVVPGLTIEDVVGKSMYDYIQPEHQETVREVVDKVFQTGRNDIYETMGTGPDGSTSWYETRIGPIERDGQITSIIQITSDITERKQREEELREHREHLEELVKERTEQLEEAVQTADVANRTKSDFLASMSHELRTPLNAVIGFSQVLQEQYFGKLNEKQVEYVADILESGQHLLSLINDILDLAKIEAGKMELELSKVIIKDLLKGSLVMIKEKALVHRISLDSHTTKELEDLGIEADERRLKQVMFNLLSNAAKFTPDGGAISVECKKEGKELIISVSDNGIGIAPEERERIFGEFYQPSGTIKDKTPGTGLGLPLTEMIVEMHGGRIWVESEGLGKGSRFTFTLPVVEPTELLEQAR